MKLSPEFNLIYGMCSLFEILGICLLAFAFYLMPHVFWGSLYPLPDFIFSIEWWLDMHIHGTKIDHIFVIFVPFFLGGLLCLFEARNLTARIEKQLLGQDDLSLAEQLKIHYSENLTSIFRVLASISIVFIIAWLLAYLI